jgi:serine/threonine protein kinase/Tol biopolymer transport system component
MQIGTRLGAYEIIARIGAGGMGEVYRAVDTNLKRQVAIKVLPPSLVDDPDRLARFQREAEVLASLNHPNIAGVYGLERADGRTAIAMELADGPTLADRIAQGPLPVDEALAIARQIADALDAAHEQGIVHRDLKPANVTVTTDGAVKVLDFGLAKPGAAGATAVTGASDPTMLSPAVTQAGLILGTAAYMSPEQARGKRVDKRTDIWAFGCVLYEMITGRRAFGGDDVVATLAAVVKDPPDWTALPAAAPESLRRLLTRLLEKDPRRRVRDIGDVHAELEANDATSDSTVVPAQPRVRTTWIVAAASVGVIAGAIAVWLVTRDTTPANPPPVLRLSVRLPPDQRIVASGNDLIRFAISPDGSRIVYGANRRLHLRPLDSVVSTVVANTEDATAPFFSPDGESIGYVQNGRLVRLAVSGGTATPLAEVAAPAGAHWIDGTIVYADARHGIFSVDATGGEPVLLAAAESAAVLAPHVLPRSDWLLFTQTNNMVVLRQYGVPGATAGLMQTLAYNRSTRERRVVLDDGPATYLPTGHLVYGAGSGVFAVPFDAVRAEVTGSAVRLDLTEPGVPVVSASGTLAYAKVMPDVSRRTVWVSREGRTTPLPIEPGPYRFPRLAPDGTRVAMTRADPRQNTSDIWVYDVDGSSAMRLTFDGQGTTPAWTTDGLRLAYSEFGKGPSRLLSSTADGSGRPRIISEGANIRFPYTWFDRNTKLVFAELGGGGLDVGVVEAGGTDRLLLSSPASETRPDVSPDGRWLAYTSNESGRDEIYVRPMTDVESGKWQLSTDGGHSPVWTSGGRELVYRAPSHVMSVAVRPGETFRFESPHPVFADTYVNDTGGRSYDVAPDGRFLMLSDEANSTDEIHLVINWIEEVKRQLQAK